VSLEYAKKSEASINDEYNKFLKKYEKQN